VSDIVGVAAEPAPDKHPSLAPLGYRPGLDGLRAIAIGLVLLHHTAAILVPSWAEWFFPGGFLGVDLFFVLSGFLITTLLLERRDRSEAHPLRSFYARRALRLLPAVVALLLANLIVAAITADDVRKAVGSFLVVLSYTTNWALLYGFGEVSRYLTHLWSLAIEEQFYVVWPLLLLAALRTRQSRGRIALLCVLVAVAAAVWRSALYDRGWAWLRIYIRTDARADALLVGVVLALLRVDGVMARIPRPVRSIVGLVALTGFIVAAAGVHGASESLYRGGFTVVAFLAAAALAIELAGPWILRPVLGSRPFVLVGQLSYSLYLWHFLVFWIVAEHVAAASPVLRVALAWTATAVAAFACYRLVELPALRIKDRIGRRGAAHRQRGEDGVDASASGGNDEGTGPGGATSGSGAVGAVTRTA
jgi:peptidoglycan/LPS O-acetylase OafA/YrhL